MSMRMLQFKTTVGTEAKEYKFEYPGTVKFRRAVADVSKKLDLAMDNIAIAPEGGAALTHSEYQLTVEEVNQRYGARFLIINKGIVG